MTIRLASVLLALTLPMAAQNPVPAPAPAPAPAADAVAAENLFFKAFYLDRNRDYAGAMDLYQKFLDAAPDHKHAPEAAKFQLALLDRTGKSKERDAFQAKYEKQLAAAPRTPPQSGDRPAGGDGEGARGDRPAPGAGGQAGARGQRGSVLRGNKKIADMTAEETTQLKESVANSTRMVEMMRQNGNEGGAKKLETNLDALKKALDANKTEDAQKALDAIREAMPARGGRGGAGGGAGGGGNSGSGSGGGR